MKKMKETLGIVKDFIPPVEKPHLPKSYREPGKPPSEKLGKLSYADARALLPQELFDKMPPRGDGEWSNQNIAYAKYTASPHDRHPSGKAIYITEVVELSNGDIFFNGYAERAGGPYPLQLDSFHLSELCELDGIARDPDFQPTRIKHPSNKWSDCDWGEWDA